MADGRELAPAQEPRYLLRSEHPQVAVTWSTSILSDRPKPDTLKLRKRVTAWPLEFTFKVGAGLLQQESAALLRASERGRRHCLAVQCMLGLLTNWVLVTLLATLCCAGGLPHSDQGVHLRHDVPGRQC